jgi:hypothetical protein
MIGDLPLGSTGDIGLSLNSKAAYGRRESRWASRRVTSLSEVPTLEMIAKIGGIPSLARRN